MSTAQLNIENEVELTGRRRCVRVSSFQLGTLNRNAPLDEWQGTSMDDCITSAEHSMSFNAIEQEQQEGRQQCSNQM